MNNAENIFLPSLRVSFHITTPPPEARCHFVRIFANPDTGWDAEDFEPTSGQPWKPYFMTVLIVAIDGIAEVCGALTLPTFCTPALRKIGRRLNIRRFFWRSWDETKKLMLPPVFLDV